MNAVLRDWQDSLRQQAGPEQAYRVDTVLVPLDGSNISRAALPVARTLAKLEGAVLHVAHLGERLLGARQTLEELGLSSEELHGVVLDQLIGEPAEATVRFAQQLPAPVIVTCTDAGSESSHAGIEKVAEAALLAAAARVVIVAPGRGNVPWQLRKVVLAHDGTPTSDLAIALTADLARRAEAEVTALHVAARKASHPAEPGSLPAPRYLDQPQHEWPAWAGEFVGRMMALGAPPAALDCKLLVTGGQPGSEIAQFACDHEADLVVAAWDGMWHPEHNGVVKAVMRRSRCPVLLICAPTPAGGQHSVAGRQGR